MPRISSRLGPAVLAAALTLGPAAALFGPTPARGQSCDKVDPAEAAFWDSIKNSASPQDYQAYLDTFPGGCYAALARVRSKAGAPGAGANGAAPVPGPATRGIDPAPTKPPAAAIDIEPQDRESFITRTANVRDAPSAEANKLETLSPGTGVAITGRVRGTDWYRVARNGRDIGFVFGPLLAEFGGQVAPPPVGAPGGAPVQPAAYPPPAYPAPAYPAGQNPAVAEALRKCPAANGATPLYSQYDQTAQAFAQQFGPALATMMQAFQGQAAGFLRQFGNKYGVNIEAMMQQALGSLQRDVQAMQTSAALRQRIEQQERRDLDALQLCARNRVITRQEALAVVQDREATLAQHTQLNAQSRQLVQQRRQDYEQTVPPQQSTASQAPPAQQAQVAQAKAQYDQQAAVTAQANEAALLKQRAQLERSKALLSQA
ncbi:MAG: SH3 domain-containing protein [Alphaproteobacteria bacterium]|nr:SH3 domain-containing protein [Alphaproteobacteria bacterium]